jgi:hypothetical protein
LRTTGARLSKILSLVFVAFQADLKNFSKALALFFLISCFTKTALYVIDLILVLTIYAEEFTIIFAVHIFVPDNFIGAAMQSAIHHKTFFCVIIAKILTWGWTRLAVVLETFRLVAINWLLVNSRVIK